MGIIEGSSQGFGVGSVNSIEGTGQNVLADALIGFAKGFAERQAKEREEQASNQRAVLQAMIQQEMVSPAMDGKPDFKALGFGWKMGVPANTYKGQKQALEMERAKSEIASEELKRQIDTDPGKYMESQMSAWEKANSLLQVANPTLYAQKYAEEAAKTRAMIDSGQISYLRPFPQAPATQAPSVPETPDVASQGNAWMDQNIRNPISALASFVQNAQKQAPSQTPTAPTSAQAPVTPAYQKVNPATGKQETWFKVRDKKSGKIGMVTEQELAVNPDLERV